MEPERDSLSNQGGLASRKSKFNLPSDTLIKTRDGQNIEFGDIKNRTPVFCPHHLDKSASAFVGIKSDGFRFLHCMTCQTTWHQKNSLYQNDPSVGLDFVGTMRKIKDMPLEEMRKELSKLNANIDTQELQNANITFLNSKFLTIDEFKPGLTLIKSPKGSGKTHSLTDVIEKTFYRNYAMTLDEFELNEDDEGPPSQWETGKRVLLIGHRQALIKSMCKRLDLNCYLDESDPSINKHWYNFRKRYGVCLDSIKKIPIWNYYHTYHLVIIDEVEQVLAHLLASTSKDAVGYLEQLYEIIYKAEYVIAMDADIGWTSFLTLNSMRNSASYLNNSQTNEIIINEYVPENQVFDLYDLKSDLVAQLYKDLDNGNKVFVSTNSKKQVDRLSFAIRDKFPDMKVMAITSENSSTKEVNHFISNIKEESRRYDLVISSPSLGTGIDITFSDDEQFYDSVYGIYESLVNSHTEIDQQLSRVRHPKSVKVWISPRTFNFETSFDVIKADLICSNAIANTAIDRRMPIADQVFSEDNRFLRTAALILSDQRSSKNQLKNNFVEYKKRNGWTANLIVETDNKNVGLEILRRGKQLEDKAYSDRLMNSPPIDHIEFSRIEDALEAEDSKRISNSEYWSYQRMKMEVFYCRAIDENMIAIDNRWKLRQQYWSYKKFIDRDSIDFFIDFAKFMDPIKLKKLLSTIVREESVLYLVYGLLSKTPFYSKGHFDTSIEFNNEDLHDFAMTSIKLKGVTETQMGISVRKDVLNKANVQLNLVLKIIGLKTIQTRTQKRADGNKYYFYKLDPSSLDLMNSLLFLEPQRQSQWNLINERYGFK